MDGGDIEFINFKDGILKLRFKGECAHCELQHITMKFAIEKNILEKIPEVKKVTEVKMSVIQFTLIFFIKLNFIFTFIKKIYIN